MKVLFAHNGRQAVGLKRSIGPFVSVWARNKYSEVSNVKQGWKYWKVAELVRGRIDFVEDGRVGEGWV